MDRPPLAPIKHQDNMPLPISSPGDAHFLRYLGPSIANNIEPYFAITASKVIPFRAWEANDAKFGLHPHSTKASTAWHKQFPISRMGKVALVKFRSRSGLVFTWTRNPVSIFKSYGKVVSRYDLSRAYKFVSIMRSWFQGVSWHESSG